MLQSQVRVPARGGDRGVAVDSPVPRDIAWHIVLSVSDKKGDGMNPESYQIALLKGDGIGPEVIDAAVTVLQRAGTVYGNTRDAGGTASTEKVAAAIAASIF